MTEEPVFSRKQGRGEGQGHSSWRKGAGRLQGSTQGAGLKHSKPMASSGWREFNQRGFQEKPAHESWCNRRGSPKKSTHPGSETRQPFRAGLGPEDRAPWCPEGLPGSPGFPASVPMSLTPTPRAPVIS